MLHAVSSLVGLNKLFDSTLGVDAASIDSGAGGFSTSLHHLLICTYVRTANAGAGAAALLRFNNDSGTNYIDHSIRVSNTTVSGLLGLTDAQITVPALGNGALASAFGSSVWLIPAYGDTTGHKSVNGLVTRVEDTAADCQTYIKGCMWKSTAAISRVSLSGNAENLLAGSRLAVFGLG